MIYVREEEDDFDLNFSVRFKFESLRNEDRTTMIDLAAFSNSFTFPFFIIELDKERPSPLQDHKQFSKLLSVCSQSCLNLCYEARQKGKDPELVKVFGIWIGATQFRFCFADPVFTVNHLRKRTEIAIHLPFAPEWRFDLLEILGPSDCECECCTGIDLKATILSDATDVEIPQVTSAVETIPDISVDDDAYVTITVPNATEV